MTTRIEYNAEVARADTQVSVHSVKTSKPCSSEN